MLIEALKRAGLLSAAVVALWAMLAVPAHLLAGADGLVGLTYAAAVCWVPGCLVFLGSAVLPMLRDPLKGMLVAASLRMGAGLVAALAVKSARPHWGLAEFFAWLIVFYLLTLSVETRLLGGREKSVSVSTGG